MAESQTHAWILSEPNYEGDWIIGIFTDEDLADAILAECDRTPTGKIRGRFSIDEYPLNPRTFKDATS